MASAWWQARLKEARAHVEELEEAISKLLDGSIQSYQLDTGQTRTLVTRQQMSPMYLALERAFNRVSVLEIRCGVAPSVTRVVPLT